MRLAFSGSHRTGKSTLANQVADEFGLPYIETTTAGLTAKLGIDLKAPLTFAQRLAYQHEVLANLERSFNRSLPHYVTDRTPLDAAAYLLADVANTTGTHDERQAALSYVERCVALTRDWFDTIILVPPALPLTDEANKGAANVAYQEHHHTLIAGLLAVDEDDDSVDWQQMPRGCVKLRDRMDYVTWVLGRFSVKPLDMLRAA